MVGISNNNNIKHERESNLGRENTFVYFYVSEWKRKSVSIGFLFTLEIKRDGYTTVVKSLYCLFTFYAFD